MNDSVVILFDGGMSDDPAFKIVSKSGKIIANISCRELFLNSSGTMYTSGHVNNMYNRKKKFQIKNDTVLEITQPFSYVGMKGKTLKDIVLYKDKTGDDIVARLPKGYEIEILLCESGAKDYDMDRIFLVKTDFGLLGWLRDEEINGGVLKELYYAGD
ncbi:MAG: hypothetical protein ACJ77K_16585 [Bacteroidia bacterium]